MNDLSPVAKRESFRVLRFPEPASADRRDPAILGELLRQFRILQRLAGDDFIRRNYLNYWVREDIACYRRHRGERWDQTLRQWVPKQKVGAR